CQYDGEGNTVQDIKTQQGGGPYGRTAQQGKAHVVVNLHTNEIGKRALMPKQGGSTRHIRTNRYRPYCQLIPREQITAKTQQKCEGQEDHSHAPVEFTRGFIGSSVKGTRHMHHNHEDHSMGSVTVYVTEYIPKGHDILQVFHVIISSRNRWHIV